MQKIVEVKIKGSSPMLMHNGMLADPENPIVMDMKAITSIKAKDRTEEHIKSLRRLEWQGGLWLDDEGRAAIPPDAIEKCIIEGARKTRDGKAVESGVNVRGFSLLEFPDAGKSLDKLYESGKYFDARLVKSNPSNKSSGKIMRVRPFFGDWGLKMTVYYDDRIVASEDALIQWIDTAGRLIGLGDYRPRYGRFEIV